MGVLDYFTASSPDDKRREEVRTGAVAPDRSERKRCWEARDKYFACLDRHDVIDPVTGEGKAVADKNCAAEDAVFGQDCATAWVCLFFVLSLFLFVFLGGTSRKRGFVCGQEDGRGVQGCGSGELGPGSRPWACLAHWSSSGSMQKAVRPYSQLTAV